MNDILQEFIEVNDRVQELGADRKEENEILKGLKPEVVKYLETVNDEHSTVIDNRKIYLKTSKSKKQPNLNALTKILTEYFKGDSSKADQCANFIWENREIVEKPEVKIGKVRGKKDK